MTQWAFGRMRGSVATKEGKDIDVSFHDVLLVPTLGRNLLSVARIVERGGDINFTKYEAYISVRGVRLPLRVPSNRDRLYELEFQNYTSSCQVKKLIKKDEGFVAAETQNQGGGADHAALVVVNEEHSRKEIQSAEAAIVEERKRDYKSVLLSGPEIRHQQQEQVKQKQESRRRAAAPIAAEDTFSGTSWSASLRDNGRKIKSYGRGWERKQMMKHMRSRRQGGGAVRASVGDRRRGMDKWKPRRITEDEHQHQQGSMEHTAGSWSMVHGYKGKRLRWSRVDSRGHTSKSSHWSG